MMYIEHTNLEDNLHHILTNRIPTSSSPSASEATAAFAASALLARVREAHNSASSALQQETTTSSNAQFHRNNFSTSNIYKTSAKECIRPEPNLLSLDNFNSNDFNKEQRKISTAVNNISPPRKQEETDRQRRREGEESEQYDLQRANEEEQHYELQQVIASNRTAQAENSKTFNKIEKKLQLAERDNCASTSRYFTDLKVGQNILSSIREAATGPSKVQVQEDEEFEYVVTRVPKRKFPQQVASEELEFNTTLNRRVRRPVPEAIPIDTHSRIRPYNGKQTPPIPQLIVPEIRRQIPNLKKYTINSQGSYNTHRELNGYASATDFYDEEENNCDYYSDSEIIEAPSTARTANNFYNRQEAQMGLDILNKLKHFFNWNSSTNHFTTGHHEGNRKRRSDDWAAGESIGPQEIKYRKVENRFPKYIATRPEEDDINEFLPPFTHHNQQQRSQKYDKQYILNNSAQSSRTLLEMSNRRSIFIDKPPLRKSMFSAPHVTQHIIKNTPYADVEFSDDDEPILIKGFGIQPKLTSVKRVPESFNIPNIRTDERVKSTQHKPPPPPLIEPGTGSILQSSLIPRFENIRKNTYAETLRQSAATGHVLGGRSSNSSGASTSESSRLLNGLNTLRTNHWSTQNRSSILSQEKQSEEREKYQQLLEKVVPRLYGSTGVENKLSLNSAAQRKRSALLLGNAVTSSARSSPTINRRSMGIGQSILKRQPLSSTINLDDDDDEDVTITGVSQLKITHNLKTKKSLPTTVIVDDDEISDIDDLGNEERHVLSACAKIQKDKNSIASLYDDKKEKPNKSSLPFVEPVNSLQDRFNSSPHLKDNWLDNFQSKWFQRKKNRHDEVKETVKVTEKLTAERRAAEAEIQERLRNFQIVDPELLVVDDFEDLIEEPEFVELGKQHRARIHAAICAPLDQILVSKFNLNITGRDIHTLLGQKWLNDEVINFYMNLITERGEKKHESHGLPRVYAMNTFFVPRLMQAGHAGVKRWTRKVDIFTKDILPVPVHVGGVHWCMAIIHMKNRTIKYYDSMGTPNPTVLKALEQYLKDESMDKRRQTFDTSGFVIESVQGVPRQMNGSDCGVFSCMFAEYITRNREITFSQQNMEYFRQKMILEIVMGELLQ